VISICVGLFFRLFGSALPFETIGVAAIKDTSAGTVSSVDLYVGPAHNFSIGPDIRSL
jgi:hypothetical protein